MGFSFDSATTAVVSKAITQAESEVNKFLSKRYDVDDWTTLALTPPTVTTLTEWYATGLCYRVLGRLNKELRATGEDYIKMAKDNLIEISQYKANVVDATGNLIPESTNASKRVLCNTSRYSSTFNEDDELDQAVDQNKLDDIRSDRE